MDLVFRLENIIVTSCYTITRVRLSMEVVPPISVLDERSSITRQGFETIQNRLYVRFVGGKIFFSFQNQ